MRMTTMAGSYLRSNFAGFNDFTDNSNGDFEIRPAIAGTIAQRRAYARGESISVLYRLQIHQSIHEWAMDSDGQPIVDVAFGEIEWNSVPRQYVNVIEEDIDEVSPKTRD